MLILVELDSKFLELQNKHMVCRNWSLFVIFYEFGSL